MASITRMKSRRNFVIKVLKFERAYKKYASFQKNEKTPLKTKK